jgi:predicted membrane-bound spermidine synthase
MNRSGILKAIGLALISAAAFIFEITLTRLFAIQQFHHFAFVVVSLAVLGFAASGLILSLQTRPPGRTWLAGGFSLFVILSYLVINTLPFDSYSIAWDPKQIWILALYFSAAGLPFLFAGWVIGAAMNEAGENAYQPYAANLIGSALGCPLALGSIAVLGGERTVLLSAFLGLLAGGFFAFRRHTRMIFTGAMIFLGLGFFWMPASFKLELSPYKPLSIAQLVPDAEHSLMLWSASSRLDVIETDTTHVLPGLSINASILPPRQFAVYIDGDGPIPITHLSPDDPVAQKLSEAMPTDVAYHLRPHADVLILQPGAGLDAIIALASSADHVTISEDEPLISHILNNEYETFSKELLKNPRLQSSNRTARGTLEVSEINFDIISFALSDGYRPVTSGAFSLTENYVLTVESLQLAYNRLKSDGLLVITRWLGTPPSESARAWATLLSALKFSGVEEVSKYLVAFRGMRTATMIASKEPFTTEELNVVREFFNQNAFDPIYLPDLDPTELNQYNQIPQDVYHELYQSLLDDLDLALSNYAFDISPPTDDHPFFFHFFRWRQTPEILSTLGLIWQPFGGSGYLVLIALLTLMVIFALPVAISPLILLRKRRLISKMELRFPAYFACLGAGYLFVEISLIQHLTLLLDRPSIALAAVLFSMLLASGLGSLSSRKIPLRVALAILIGILLLLNLFLPLVTSIALPWNGAARFLLVALLLAPAGFLMGIPFVTGLRIMENKSHGLIPWAWAVNGAVSGIAGVLSTMIGLEWGLSATLLLGAAIYLLSMLTAPSEKGSVQGLHNLTSATN